MKTAALLAVLLLLLLPSASAAYPPPPTTRMSLPTVAETTTASNAVDQGVDLPKVLPSVISYGTAPPEIAERANASMVYDPALQETVLFGGAVPGGNALGDTWVLKDPYVGAGGQRVQPGWAQLTSSPSSPPAREGAAMTYDAIDQAIVMFGGEAQGTYYGDLWEFNASGWHSVSFSAPGPGARAFAAIGYDSADSLVVLFGGAIASGGTLSFLSDTWYFSAGSLPSPTWSQYTTGCPGSCPEPRQRAVMATLVSTGVLLGGGDIGHGSSYSGWWDWGQSTGWAAYSGAVPPRDDEASMATDMSSGSPTGPVWYYGNNSAGVPVVWSLQHTGGFAQVLVSGYPMPRHDAALTVSSDGNLLLFGGLNGTSAFNDTDLLTTAGGDFWTLNLAAPLNLTGVTATPCDNGRVPFGTVDLYPQSGLLQVTTEGVCAMRIDLSNLFWGWANNTPSVCPPVGVSICANAANLDNFTLQYERWLGQLTLLSQGPYPDLRNLTVGPVDPYLSTAVGQPSVADSGAWGVVALPPGPVETYSVLRTSPNATINASYTADYWSLGNSTLSSQATQDMWGMGQDAWFGPVNATQPQGPPPPGGGPPFPGNDVVYVVIAIAVGGAFSALFAFDYRQRDRTGRGILDPFRRLLRR